MLSFQGSLTEHWEMFINVGPGLILDLHLCETALKRLGWLSPTGGCSLLPGLPAAMVQQGATLRRDGEEAGQGGKVRPVRMLSLP